MRVGCYLGMVGSIIIAKRTLPLSDICVSIVHTNRVAKLGADDFIEIKVRTIPEENPAAEDSVVVIRSQADKGFANVAYTGVPL